MTLSESLPAITRLGFDHGWLLLGPTFLKLGMPVLLVDTALVGDCTSFGLEPFGERDPRKPLPISQLRVEVSGRYVGISDTRPADVELITIGTFEDPTRLKALLVAEQLALLIGDTRAAQQSWSALWQFWIGVGSIASGQRRCSTSTK